MSLADIELPVSSGDHVMVDLECLGADRANPVITSIGAVLFNKRGAAWDWPGFHVDIDIDSSMASGALITRSTFNFWMRDADDEARLALVRGQSSKDLLPLYIALNRFADWLSNSEFKTIWANGAADDLTWLRAAYDSLGMSAPWDYGQPRCYRTVRSMLDPSRSLEIMPDLAHHALHDARAQAQTLLRMNRRMDRLLRSENEDR